MVAAVPVALMAALLLNIPYFAITPGPALDVVTLIEIEGAPTHAVSGRLLLTTVSLRPIRVFEAIRGWLDSDDEILSRSAIIPSGETEDEAARRSTEQMEESQQHAAAAALSLLGYDVKVTPSGARVVQLLQTSPANRVLKPGDVIVGADTTDVKRSEDLVAAIKRHKVGDDIVLKVRRHSETLTVRTRTIPRDDDPSEPIIGVSLDNAPHVELPLAIDIESFDIGGPSAGLMYALGIVDLLDTGDLASGRTIAGTGEISIDGEVGPVGGIDQKIASARRQDAELFLVPAVELEEACARSGSMPVYAVQKLEDAVRVLRDPVFARSRGCP